MSTVTTTRRIDLTALTFPARMTWAGDGGEVEADVPEADLRAAVDAAPDDPTEERQANASTIDTAITNALTELRTLVAAPALPVVPDGTMTTAQLSNALRTLRNEAQATRAGAQKVAATLAQTIRLVRGDFDGID